MSSGSFAESTVESAALAWLESLGWQIAHGPDIAPDMHSAERTDYGEVVLAHRVRDTLLPKLISGEFRLRSARNRR